MCRAELLVGVLGFSGLLTAVDTCIATGFGLLLSELVLLRLVALLLRVEEAVMVEDMLGIHAGTMVGGLSYMVSLPFSTGDCCWELDPDGGVMSM